MFEHILTEKSSVEIKDGTWNIQKQYSEYNQCGSLGRNDYIRRQDAVRLLAEMNNRLSEVCDKAVGLSPQLKEELLLSTDILSYAMWGIRELDSSKENSESTDISIT